MLKVKGVSTYDQSRYVKNANFADKAKATEAELNYVMEHTSVNDISKPLEIITEYFGNGNLEPRLKVEHCKTSANVLERHQRYRLATSLTDTLTMLKLPLFSLSNSSTQH